MIFDITNLKSIRRKLGLTQTDFAKRAMVSQSLIAKVESGKIDPTYTKVKKISEAIERLSHEKETEAREIMVKKLITAKPKEKITSIINTLNRHGISQMPVIDNDNLLGIIYENTILEKSAQQGFPKLTAEDVMTEAPPIVGPATNISVLSGLLKHYPVVLVSEKGKIVGLISKADILKKLI